MLETVEPDAKGVVMKKILVISALAALAFGTSQALAATHHHAHATKTLVVAMHDPGCHSFLIHGKYKTSAFESGAVRVQNADEATLKVASRNGTQFIKVGKSLVLQHGQYVVMMVGQAADDNYLKLTVR
jgi:hypothetical protein